ncbi:hypothetical protein [Anaeromyxobacter sp. PSR-1]|uniref:hypothetical protein n=1 Tax=Anaeromyxobacter sp. PSR-1 TaxID=1300915 RepID=UPI0005E0E67D|nr:hypothetical protein [Anaeromyxobacter sp. PSR-1]GAO04207.1 hypothetical protein PSR1_03097 [Anaeromyxobacter sp. PSR-1]
MSTLPLHPAIVHVPLGLAMVVPLVAAGLALALWRGALPRRAFAVVVALQAILVGGGALAMQLGERDEKQAETVISEKLIEAHEERAEVFVWAAGAVLAVSAAVLVVPAAAATAVAAVVVAGTLGVAALAVSAGQAGGELVYRHGAASAYLPRGAPAEAIPGVGAARVHREAEHDDEDR